MSTTRPDLSARLSALPTAPGVYQLKDQSGVILYIGKAAVLRSRVRSYFQSTRGMDPKTRELVSRVTDFEIIRTDSATEALILENELIKKHLPRYNIMLKDSKTYPYLKITQEEWPKIIYTRLVVQDGGRYFGPYTSAGSAYQALSTLNRLFPYRKCEQRITGKEEVCLYFHMHQCLAPCIGVADKIAYAEAINGAALFLGGRGEEVLGPIQREMQRASDELKFERAAELRDRISTIKHVLERQKVVGVPGADADVIAVAQGAGGDAGVQIAFVRNGKVLGSEFCSMKAMVEDLPEGILASFLSQFYAHAAIVPSTLIVQHDIPPEDRVVILEWLMSLRKGRVLIVRPQRGKRKALVEMVARSAVHNLEQSRIKFLSDEQKTTASMTELADALALPRMPQRIECFDISNLQGTNPVASMVVFEGGKPSKREYRRFSIKTVEGANDFAMMHEVVSRRFKRAAASEDGETGKWTALPDLVIVDGGKGQLNAALEAMALTGVQVPTVGLAKENEELFLPGEMYPVVLPRDSQALFLVQRVRDEAHRFAVSFHRQRRAKASIKSSLDDVSGIGPKRKKALLQHFGSLKRVREATVDEIATVAGISPSVAARVKSSV